MSGFKVTRYRVRIPERFKRNAELPFSAVFLSDLHNTGYGKLNCELLGEIRNQNPELVLIAGDMLTSTVPPQMDAALALLDELTKRYPVYYVNGNHEQRLKEKTEKYGSEYEKYSEAIRSFGVHLLENASERLEIRRIPMAVWGYELPLSHYARWCAKTLTKEEMISALGEADASAWNILLAHSPVYFSAYAGWGADLTLSGHLHGGVVRLPLLGGVISPQLRLFPNYARGIYEIDGKKLITGAGLGSHTINLRINNPPELVVVDFV